MHAVVDQSSFLVVSIAGWMIDPSSAQSDSAVADLRRHGGSNL
jgi:hypothetical protein